MIPKCVVRLGEGSYVAAGGVDGISFKVSDPRSRTLRYLSGRSAALFHEVLGDLATGFLAYEAWLIDLRSATDQSPRT